MQRKKTARTTIIILSAIFALASVAAAGGPHGHKKHAKPAKIKNVQLGPRPYYLVADMDESKLKTELEKCSEGPFKKTDFSIAHRGAGLQFPEHTLEGYLAAARMGAGIIECDVTFTKDRELVCRHSQCDLHTTTDVLAREDLRWKCSVPPAFSADGELLNAGSIRCCTSDFTLEEFKSLCGKMDASNSAATTIEEYMNATPSWRTDLYATCGTLLSHAESIELFNEGDYTQEDYAQQMIDEYKAAGVKPKNVYAQSFNLDDVLYWITYEPQFGKQAVFLDSRRGLNPNNPDTWSPTMEELFDEGVNIIAPPMQVLMTLDENKKIVPSIYAKAARAAGLDIITWTLERSGLLKDGGGSYYSSVSEVINNDGDMLDVLDVLAQDVGIIGIFSDWPATVTYYANCKRLK
jgi:glycerophosphoryl diester phosphodiesterase